MEAENTEYHSKSRWERSAFRIGPWILALLYMNVFIDMDHEEVGCEQGVPLRSSRKSCSIKKYRPLDHRVLQDLWKSRVSRAREDNEA